MAFGFSVSDLRTAWQLGSFLHEKCFTRAQGAGASLNPPSFDHVVPRPLFSLIRSSSNFLSLASLLYY